MQGKKPRRSKEWVVHAKTVLKSSIESYLVLGVKTFALCVETFDTRNGKYGCNEKVLRTISRSSGHVYSMDESNMLANAIRTISCGKQGSELYSK